MSKHDYTELDAAILSRIAQKPVNFTQLQSGAVQKAADALVTGSYKPAWRFIDSRLQALLKQDDALILQLVEALENFPSGRSQAITAGRARLGRPHD